MKCPHCGERSAVEVDMHSGGFSADDAPIKECGACGLVWRIKTSDSERKIDIIKPAHNTRA